MINAGFNPLQEIARKTGKSISELKEEMSKGAISAQMVQEAFISATSAGGKFFGMSEAASKTINGQISMMEDAMDAAFNELGTKSEGIIMGSIQTITKLIENYEKVGKAIITLAGTYGTYRAAVILTTAAEKAQALARLAQIKHTTMLELVTGALTKKMKALNAVMKLNPYALAAAALVGIGGAIWTATEGNRELKKSIEETSEGIIKEVNNVNSLAAKLQDSNTSEAERLELLKQLKEINPDIVKGIDDEAKSLANLQENVDAYNARKQVEYVSSESGEKFEYEKSKELVAKLEEDAKKAEASLTNAWSDLATKAREAIMSDDFSPAVKEYVEKVINDVTKTVDERRVELGKARYINGATAKDNWLLSRLLGSMGGVTTKYVEISRQLQFAMKQHADNTDAYKARIESTIDALYGASEEASNIDFSYLWGGQKQGGNDDGNNGGTQAPQVKYTEDASKTWEQASKDALSGYREAKKALDAAKKEGKTLADLKALQDDLEKKKQKLLYYNPNALSKGGGTKQHAAQKELTQKKNEIALERKAQDAEHNMKMSGIKAIADDGEREREQRKLENEKSIRDIERRKEDYIEALTKAEVDKQVAAKKKTINVSAIRTEVSGRSEVKNFDIEIENTRKAQANADAKREKEKLDAQRKAWQDYYIEYGTYQEKRKYLAEQYEDKIAKAEKKGLEGEVKSLKAEKDRVLAELEKGMNAQYQNIFKDPEKMTKAAISEAIQLGQEEITKITAKGTLNEKDMENLKALQEAVDRLQEYEQTSPFAHWGDGLDGIINKLTSMDVIQKRVNEAKKTGNKESQKAAEMELAAAQESLKKNIKGLATQSVIGGLEKVAETMHEIAEITGDVKLEEMAKQFDSLTTSLNSALMGLMMGGPLGMFLSLAMTFLTGFINSIQEFFTFGAANTAALENYAKTIESMNLTLDFDKFDTIFGEDRWSKIAEASDKLRQNLEKIDNLTFTQIEPAVQSTGMAIGGQIKSKEQRTKSGLSLSEVYVNAKGKGKKKNSGTLQELFGEDLFDENGNLRTDKIEEAKAALESLRGMKLVDDTAIKALEQGIEYAENVKAAGDALKEAASEYMGGLAQTLGDVLVNNILRGVDAMDELGAAGADIITQLGRDLAQTWVMQNYLNQFEEGMQQAFEDNDQERIASIVGDIVSGFPAMMETGSELVKQLYDSTKGTEYDVYEHAKEQQQQQASQRGYAALSEETGSELSGRALAQYESNLRIEASQREQTASIVEIKASMLTSLTQQMGIKSVAEDCRRILAETQIDVRGILNNTEAMVKPIANLSSKMDKWDSKIMSL